MWGNFFSLLEIAAWINNFEHSFRWHVITHQFTYFTYTTVSPLNRHFFETVSDYKSFKRYWISSDTCTQIPLTVVDIIYICSRYTSLKLGNYKIIPKSAKDSRGLWGMRTLSDYIIHVASSISMAIHYKMWNGITHPFPSFSGAVFSSHSSQSMLVKRLRVI